MPRLLILHAPNDHNTALAAGAWLVPHSSSVAIALPGSHVWDGRDHAFSHEHAVFIVTRPAWGAGDELLVAIPEHDAFPAIAGERDRW